MNLHNPFSGNLNKDLDAVKTCDNPAYEDLNTLPVQMCDNPAYQDLNTLPPDNQPHIYETVPL